MGKRIVFSCPDIPLLPKEERKPLKDMIPRVVVNSKDGDID